MSAVIRYSFCHSRWDFFSLHKSPCQKQIKTSTRCNYCAAQLSPGLELFIEYVARDDNLASIPSSTVGKMLDTQFSAIFMKKISSNFSSERCFSFFSISLGASRVTKTISTQIRRRLIQLIRSDNYFQSKIPTIRIYIFLADSNQKTFHSTPCKTRSPNARDFSH